jgi:methylated-DNA-[protein]-cysteine S-methyltransferase
MMTIETIPETSATKTAPAAELLVTWRTPLGPMTGRVSAQGVRSLRFPPPEALTLESPVLGSVEVLAINSANRKSDAEADAPARRHADQVTQFLIQFFKGLKSACPPLDMKGASDFDRAVWEATRQIPPGQTRSYGQIATAIGRPGAARAVGGALGRNPLVLLVPCHRVIASTPGPRALCGFTGGLALKRTLLELENARL